MAEKRPRVDHARLVEDLHAQLDERLAELSTSDEWLDYLASARRFHRYSPNNQLLLALQGAEGLVASYRNWQNIPAQGGGTCQVAKGEKGLAILAPLTSRAVEVDDTTGEETTVSRLRGFRTVKVFHQGQLIDPPAIADHVMPELLAGDNRWQHVWAAVAGRLEADGFTVSRHTRNLTETWNGLTSWADRAVLVADDLEPPQALKTLFHEWGHVELDHEHRSDVERSLKEVEAESVAYLLSQTVGLDSGAYSVPYITVWAHGDIATVRRAAEQVLATTSRLVECLEVDLGIELAPDLVERATVSRTADVVPIRAEAPQVDLSLVRDTDRVPEYEEMTLPGIPGNPPDSAADVVDIESRRFLKAMIGDLEPDQRARLMSLVYDPRRAATAAAILAESGKTADQIGRLMHHFDFDIPTIRDALLSPVDDADRPTLFNVAHVRAALHAIDDAINLDELVPLVAHPAGGPEFESSGPMDDVRLLQRRIRQHAEPSTIAALASGLELEPATVIGVCRASDVPPPRTMAIAIAVRGGDAKAAYNDVTTNWPDVDGGWDQHTHPSLHRGRHLTAVSDRKPSRDILDRWTGRTRPAVPTPEPLSPS
jgi:rhodanese-related sulfurtransferase